MKHFFTFIAATLLTLPALQAQNLNIYASGLTAGAVDNANLNVKISYTLNAPATSLAILLQKGDETPVEIAITGAANLTKGAHTDVTVDLSDVPTGDYAWSIKAEGAATASEPVKLSDDSAPFQFYFPSGITVDNSFESPYFGRIYVAEGDGGQCSGGGRLTEDGIYILDTTLESVGSQAYAGNISWSADATYAEGVRSPGRLSVDATGNIFIADNSTTNSGVYVMNPAAPESNFSTVFALDNRDATGLVTANSNITHGRIPALYVEGSGDNTILYTIDRNYLPVDYSPKVNLPSGMIFKYPLGTIVPYASLPEIIYDNNAEKLVNDAMSLFPDKRGGFWIAQNRAEDAVNMPCILHINAAGIEDFNSFDGGLALGKTNASTRGGMAINPAGTLLAIGNNKYVRTYTISYDAGTGVPSLSQITENAINIAGVNIENIAFDVADNIYVISASTERFYVYALPKAENVFTTPAPSASVLAVVNTSTGVSENQIASKRPVSVQYFDLTGKPATGKIKGFVIKKTVYEDGSITNSKELK